MKSITKFIRAIERSELAYQFYLKEKKFFQAIRLYNSNLFVYSILESLLLEDDSIDKNTLICYLFHLDDWFSQFKKTVEAHPFALDDRFVFERIEGMFPFPKDLISELKNQL